MAVCCANCKVCAPRREHSSPPPEGCISVGSNPSFHNVKNTRPRMQSGVFWQRMRDSNPRERSQSPVCYRYTNPLCNGYIICRNFEKSRILLGFFTLFFRPGPGRCQSAPGCFLPGYPASGNAGNTVRWPAAWRCGAPGRLPAAALRQCIPGQW